MKNIIWIALVLALAFVSCEKDTKSKDKTEPEILSYILYNENEKDTLLYGLTEEQKSIIINEPEAEVFTFVMGKRLMIDAHFVDETALSSFRLKLEYDSINIVGDTTNTVAYDGLAVRSIFGKKDTLVSWSTTLVPEKETAIGTSGAIIKPTRQGNYEFKINLADKAGNEDSLIQKVYLITREEFLKKNNIEIK